MSDLVNYNDLLQQMRDSVPSGVQDKAEKVNQAFNTALGVHMLLSHFDFYKSTLGSFGDKLAEKGIELKNTVNNIIDDPSSILDTEAGQSVVNVAQRQLSKVVSKGKQIQQQIEQQIAQPEENIELSTLGTPQAPPVSEDVLFPEARGADIVPGAIGAEGPPPSASILPSGQGIEPSSLTSTSAFREFTQMQPEPIKISSFSELPTVQEGQELLSGARGYISRLANSASKMQQKASSAYKSLSSGDFKQAGANLEEAVEDPEFGQFVDPLRRAGTSMLNKLSSNVQGALEDRFNSVPQSIKDIAQASGMSDDDFKLSLMEPDEFKSYLGTLRGSAMSKVQEMQQAYDGARGSMNDIVDGLSNDASALGANMQQRLQYIQQSAEYDSNLVKQSAIDATKTFTENNPVAQVSNTAESLANDAKQSVKSGLADITEDSTALDEDPIGAGITAVLGLATLGDTIYNAIADNRPTPSQVGYQMGI